MIEVFQERDKISTSAALKIWGGKREIEKSHPSDCPLLISGIKASNHSDLEHYLMQHPFDLKRTSSLWRSMSGVALVNSIACLGTLTNRRRSYIQEALRRRSSDTLARLCQSSQSRPRWAKFGFLTDKILCGQLLPAPFPAPSTIFSSPIIFSSLHHFRLRWSERVFPLS